MTVRSGYFSAIFRTVYSCWDGLAVTFSHLLRKPFTIQYPDRIAKPLITSLPERSRGFLEMDQTFCTGCGMCQKQCPISCIQIDIEKSAETGERILRHFEIDLGKCMFCGICVESCKFSALRHSREFEGAVSDVRRLNVDFVVTPAPVAKPKKEEAPQTKPFGSIIQPKLANPWLSAKDLQNRTQRSET